MKLSELSPNPNNPRKITDKKKEMLKKALAKFGDISGIVYNQKSKQLVGGHQRKEVFGPDAVITIVKKYPKPTRAGTKAEGYITIKGERFSYREVWWDDVTEKAANIAANKGAGEWDKEILGNWLAELSDVTSGLDVDLTMFDSDEIKEFLGAVSFDNLPDKSKEEKEIAFAKFDCRCPKCGFEYDN